MIGHQQRHAGCARFLHHQRSILPPATGHHQQVELRVQASHRSAIKHAFQARPRCERELTQFRLVGRLIRIRAADAQHSALAQLVGQLSPSAQQQVRAFGSNPST